MLHYFQDITLTDQQLEKSHDPEHDPFSGIMYRLVLATHDHYTH